MAVLVGTRSLLATAAWLLPAGSLKNRILTRLGNEISPTARIGPSLVVGCGLVRVGQGTVIGTFNTFRSIRTVHIGDHVVIGQLNYFGAAREFQAFHPDSCSLYLEDLVIITNRHYFDCSGIIEIRERAIVGGLRSIFQTHEADLSTTTQTAGRITMHEASMTGTNCTLLKGAVVPYRSMLAAGSLLRQSADPAPDGYLMAGRPAKPVKALPMMAYWTRTDNDMPPSSVDF